MANTEHNACSPPDHVGEARALVDQILRLAASSPNVLASDTLPRILEIAERGAKVAQIAVTTTDGPDHFRIQAFGSRRGLDAVPQSVRLPSIPAIRRVVYGEGGSHVCDDTRIASELERIMASIGLLSYADFPARSFTGEVVGDVLFAFEDAGAASKAPHDLLQGISDAIGCALERSLVRARESRLACILETSADAMIAWDADRLVTDANEAALSLTGRERDALCGTSIDELFVRDRAGAPAVATRPEVPYVERLTLRTASGKVLVVGASVAPVRGDPSAVAHALLRDMSAVVRAESDAAMARSRLMQADRLTTLGTLAAGVAHEINNPAAFILLGLDMLARTLRGAGVTMEEAASRNVSSALDELRDSIRRIVDIARDLRLFASSPERDDAPPVVVDVVRTVESALTLTRGHILERARVVRELREVAPVRMDEGRLGQVIVNLLTNAAQAIPKDSDEDQAVTVTTRDLDGWVEIEVRDTGCGISPDVLDRIWTPFFTTKRAEVGTGLGLTISRGIIERAGGSIRAESGGDTGLDRGARFVIRLPAADTVVVAVPQTPPPPPSSVRRARVLLVEDEPSLARVLAEQIAVHHDVVVACDGAEALELLKERRFSAVLCDIRMPNMGGDRLFTTVKATDLEQAEAFVFMTGVGFGADVERFFASAGRPVLEKPFPVELALQAIASVLQRSKRAG